MRENCKRSVLAFMMLCILTVGWLVGCVRDSDPSPTDNSQLPRIEFVRGKSDAAPAIVFVHGFTGDGTSTWTKGNAYWPKLLTEDATFDDASIAVYYYDTTLFRSNLSLDEQARQMSLVLEQNNLDKRPIAFVCHSMGGLLVRRYMLLNPTAAKNQVQFVLYLSTPFSGSKLAALAEHFSSNPNIAEMHSSEQKHNWLNEQHSQSIEAQLFKIPTYSGYERRGIGGVLIVPEGSSTGPATKAPMAFDVDHINICKPANRDSLIYSFLVRAYRETTPLLNNQLVKRWPTREECMSLIASYGESEAEVQRRPKNVAGTQTDIDITINNGSRRRVCVVFCDVSAFFQNRMPFCAYNFGTEFTRRRDKYLANYSGKLSGWFLIFLRYRDDEGVVRDDPQCLVNLFETSTPYFDISRTVNPDRPVTLAVEKSTPNAN